MRSSGPWSITLQRCPSWNFFLSILYKTNGYLPVLAIVREEINRKDLNSGLIKWQGSLPPSPKGMINSNFFRKMSFKKCQGLYDKMMWGTISEFILLQSIYVIFPSCLQALSILLKHVQKCHSTTPFPACNLAFGKCSFVCFSLFEIFFGHF